MDADACSRSPSCGEILLLFLSIILYSLSPSANTFYNFALGISFFNGTLNYAPERLKSQNKGVMFDNLDRADKPCSLYNPFMFDVQLNYCQL